MSVVILGIMCKQPFTSSDTFGSMFILVWLLINVLFQCNFHQYYKVYSTYHHYCLICTGTGNNEVCFSLINVLSYFKKKKQLIYITLNLLSPQSWTGRAHIYMEKLWRKNSRGKQVKNLLCRRHKTWNPFNWLSFLLFLKSHLFMQLGSSETCSFHSL